jgi:site-specific DNA recombinase
MTRRLSPVAALPTRAVLYLRQSVSREDSISLELQETAGRDYCRQMGYQVVSVQADPGISGRTWDRPAVQRVMGLVEASEVDVIVVWKWSRLSRSRRDWAIAVDRIESLGGRLESATEPVDTSTATGRFTRGMLAEMAAFESDRIGEVWKEVHERRRKLGLPASGGERFGYTRNPDGTYDVDPIAAARVREAYQRIIDGQSSRTVASWLNSDGARTTRGNEWSRDRLTRYMDSGFAAGMLVRQHWRGKKVSRALHALTWLPGAHDPIITADEWDAYLAARRARTHVTQARPGYLLSGLLTCGDCGAVMWADRLGREAGYAFVCSAWKESKAGTCVTIARHRAEEIVRDWIMQRAEELETGAVAQLGPAQQRASISAQVAELTKKLEASERIQQTLLQRFLEGVVDERNYAAKQEHLAAEHARLEAEQARLTVQARQAQKTPSAVRVAALAADWDLLPVEERQTMLRLLTSSIEVVPPARRGLRASLRITPHAEA